MVALQSTGAFDRKPFKQHKMKRAKPGKDYFLGIFLVVLVIEVYTLIYWRNLSGEDK